MGIINQLLKCHETVIETKYCGLKIEETINNSWGGPCQIFMHVISVKWRNNLWLQKLQEIRSLKVTNYHDFMIFVHVLSLYASNLLTFHFSLYFHMISLNTFFKSYSTMRSLRCLKYLDLGVVGIIIIQWSSTAWNQLVQLELLWI